MTRLQKKKDDNKAKLIADCQALGWKLDNYGNLHSLTTKGRSVRLHFKKLVVRYESKTTGGEWIRLYSGKVQDVSILPNGELKGLAR